MSEPTYRAYHSVYDSDRLDAVIFDDPPWSLRCNCFHFVHEWATSFQFSKLLSECCTIEYAFETDDEYRHRLGNSKLCREHLVADTGCTRHAFNDASAFTKITNDNPDLECRVANGKCVPVAALGEVTISIRNISGKMCNIILQNCMLIPTMRVNLLSIKRLWKDHSIESTFSGKCRLHNTLNGDEYISACRGKHYIISCAFNSDSEACNLCEDDNAIEPRKSSIPAPSKPAISTSDRTTHSLFGHCSDERIKRAMELDGTGTRAINFSTFHGHGNSKWCSACSLGGSKRPKVNHIYRHRKRQSCTKFGECISSDVIDMEESSVGHHQYAICFVDKATKHLEVYYLKTKSSEEILGALKRFQREYAGDLKWNDGHVKQWHTDNGGEFESNIINDFCDKLFVEHSRSVPWRPEQNALAERVWGMLLRPMRILLSQSKVHHRFWTYAMEHAKFLHNSLPTAGLTDFVSPCFKRTQLQPDFTDVHVWGCKCYYHLERHDKVFKMDENSVEAINLGADPSGEGHIIFIPSLNRITSAVINNFVEDEFLENVRFSAINAGKHLGKHAIPRGEHEETGCSKCRFSALGCSACNTADAGRLVFNLDDNGHADHPDLIDTNECRKRSEVDGNLCHLTSGHSGAHSFERSAAARSESRDGLPSSRTRSAHAAFATHTKTFHAGNTADKAEYAHYVNVNMHTDSDVWDEVNKRWCRLGPETVFSIDTGASGSIPVPKQFKDAMASILHQRWKAATDKEIKSLHENETWEWVSESDLPSRRHPIKSRWVFTVKYLRNGTVDKFKARFVVCGYSQRPGIDYDRAFSATLRATSFRLLLAIAANKGDKLYHIDVRNAFTQATIDKDIWAHGPEGYTPKDKHGRPMLIKLKRALYGAKQSGRLWQEALRKALSELGFTPSQADPCLLYLDTPKGIIRLGCYVDDLVFSASTEHIKNWFVTEFQKRFSTTPCTDLSWFLGIAVDQLPDGKVTICQSKYITDTADKFLPNWRSINIRRKSPYIGTAADFNKMEGAKTDEERATMEGIPYMQLIGSLLWIAVMSRPDVSYALSVLCMFMSNPSMRAYEAAQHVLLYLAGSAEQRITYSPGYIRPTWTSKEEAQTYSGPENIGFHAYSDSSWGDAEPRFGYVLYCSNGPIAWTSKALKSASSSCEAEYSASHWCAREIYFNRCCMEDLGIDLQGPILLLTDNSASIDVANNLGATANTKHYERCIHWIRLQQQDKQIDLLHCDTEVMDADIFTKPFTAPLFIGLANQLFRNPAA